ncbi:MAG: MATE family efflux transporter [Ruminococcus sp.]|nr:MATE family efflux transporter [Ruminococcus sp.]
MNNDFVSGKILPTLVKFALPVLLALFLQAMYGGVDLLVVGRFSDNSSVSAVSTGSQIMQSLTTVITGLSMGTTVLLAQKIGSGKRREAGEIIAAAVKLFAVVSLLLTALFVIFARPLCRLMNAPSEAFGSTVSYLTICSAGLVFIVAYNVIGSIFRGIGDSKTPLITVAIACAANIIGDLIFVAVLKLGASGAALATVLAQALSVVVSMALIRRQKLPFEVKKEDLFSGGPQSRGFIRRMLGLGIPIALQDFLVSVSFLVILAIVNGLGLVYSASIGVAEKICMFIMLVPIAFMQSLSSFVGQNEGAGQHSRSLKAMYCGMGVSLLFSIAMAVSVFLFGEELAHIFANDRETIVNAADYLKAYAIDTLLVSFLFCFCGYYNGCGKTRFVMVQGLIGAFGIRIPVSWIMSRIKPVSMFRIGLASPCSTAVQITLCFIVLMIMLKKEKASLK